ncbi:MAG: PD-(D/E)XK nuclease family protein [Leptolyngbyaceae cyanobacterium bins.59]|nr:PD-(D/E)XK nuclease family protein [Leptolyngbyaceae cyanobacterium bins.59]
MTYHLSATKLQAYQRCPFAYYLKYECKLNANDFFGSAALGIALHQALAQIHRDWHYQNPIPDLQWIHYCWEQQSQGLSLGQIEEGKGILEKYYYRFIAEEVSLTKPLGVEGRIQGSLRVDNLEFLITGRYDRLNYVGKGLELIDYKSTREVRLPNPEEIDLQIGLYYLALEQTYHQSLRSLSLIFLRTTEKFSFKAGPEHKRKVQQIISNLAVKLRDDENWQPTPGSQCQRCTYARYCPAVTEQPIPLPTGLPDRKLQLSLALN